MASGRNVADMTVGLHFDGKELRIDMNKIATKMEDDAGKSGKSSGGKWANAWAVAAGNLMAKGVGAAINLVRGSMDNAISRMDTLNNFPQVMTSLGYSSESASASINQMNEHLDGLPTTLDGMVNGVQLLSATMGNLADGEVNATSLGLGLNDMFLAGGHGTEAAANAIEQYNKMLANGKVDMQSWQTLTNTASGQMNQLAKTMLGAEANSQTLYNALKDGTLSMDDLNAAIVQLDKEGGDGFESFSKQAIVGTQGLETQMNNVRTQLTKVVTAAMQGDDLAAPLEKLVDRVQAVIPTLVSGFVKAASAVASALPNLLPPLLDSIVDAIPAVMDGLETLISGIVAALPKLIPPLFKGIITIVQSLTKMLPRLLPQIVQAVIEIAKALTSPESLGALLQAAYALFMEIVRALPDVIVTLVEALPDIIDNIVSYLTNPDNIGLVIAAAIQLFLGIVEAVPRIIGALLGAFGTMVGKVWNFLKEQFGAFANSFGEFIGGVFKGAVNGILEWLENWLNGPIDVLNGFIDVINGAFGWIGVDLGKLDRISLPRLAEGGVAMGASAAIIGEEGREAVLPLDRNTDNWSGLLASALAEEMETQEVGTGGVKIEKMVFEINNNLDADEIGRRIMTSIRRAAA